MKKTKSKKINYPEVKIKDVFGEIWFSLKPQKWALFFAIFCIFCWSILASIYPLFYKEFFDVISKEGVKSEIASQLIFIIIKIALINFVIWIFSRIYNYLIISLEANTMARIRQRSYDYLIKHSYNFFANNFTGSLVQRVNRFAKAFEVLADQILWHVLPLFIKIISIVIIVFFVNKWIAIILLTWIIIFLSFNIIFSRWKVKFDIKVAESDSKSTGYLSDTIANQNTIQLFSKFDVESQGYKKVTDDQASILRLSWNLDSILWGVQSILGVIIEFLLFYFTIKYWEQGLVTIGVFVLFQTYIISLIEQLWGFNRVVKSVFQAYADSKEIVEIMLLPYEIKDSHLAKELNIKDGEIKFENLDFYFNETRKILKNINLKINPGEKIALIGPSGAGKTTFIRLILRLYQPTSGKIFIDSQDISEITQDSLRKNISLVPQDPILFHRTLAENISYGKENATKKEIEKAAQLAHCTEFIKNLPLGLDTYVGERGIKLSGGERQRVAIARAILKASPILILDEATSSLDSHSEMLIQDALENLMKNKTTIVIAHRLSTIQKMDRIILIDDGQIKEQGTHKDLLKKKNSLYKKLWELQAGGFLKDK